MAGVYQIGEFVLESKLGEGGMGVVFRARQVALDRWVALKLLARPATGGSTFYERFHREARAAAQLVHPNIIQIYTIGEHKGAPFYAMEYVEGEDLAHLLRDTGKLTLDEAVEIIRAVAKALALAGDSGIVHRDIKPANIMVSMGGLVKVMDFGLAKATASDHTLTQDGQIMGTPTYLSPEQGMSKEVDTRSDLYSLGCVFYECLSGNPPFQGDNLPSLIFKHLYEPVKSLREVDSAIPEALEGICNKLLAKKSEDRYQSGLELLEALAAVNTNQALAEISLSKRVRKVKAERKAKMPAQAEEDATAEASAAAEATTRVLDTPATEAPAVPPPDAMNLTPNPEAAAEPALPRPAAADSKRHMVFDKDLTLTGDDYSPADGSSGDAQKPPANEAALRLEDYRVPPPNLKVPPPPRPGGSRANLAQVPAPPPPPQPTESSSRAEAQTEEEIQPKPPSGLFMRPTSGMLIRKSGVSSYFHKQADGRWGYDISQGHCKFAEGMAVEALPGADINIGKHADCLLCTNWNRRSGCAIATIQYIESTSRAKGVDLLEEVAAVWCVTGRFDKAIGVLEEQIRNNPGNPDGYRALARIYERPDYTGKDRNRAIILYGRFVELAMKKGGYSNLEIERAQGRVAQLQVTGNQPKEAHKPGAFSGTMIHTFPCFYRSNGTVFFGLGGVNRDTVVVARAGEVDPDTGVSASEMGNPFMRATTLIRRIKSEKAKAEEREAVKKEIDRISKTSVDLLLHETGKVHLIPLKDIQAFDYSRDDATEQRTVKLRAGGHLHELIFSSAADHDADKCALMIRRLTGK
ncbi:MAG: protein kinase [Planctomycetes bacterium]|nr:protein kinase [Planctomycetota bacterium]